MKRFNLVITCTQIIVKLICFTTFQLNKTGFVFCFVSDVLNQSPSSVLYCVPWWQKTRLKSMLILWSLKQFCPDCHPHEELKSTLYWFIWFSVAKATLETALSVGKNLTCHVRRTYGRNIYCSDFEKSLKTMK